MYLWKNLWKKDGTSVLVIMRIILNSQSIMRIILNTRMQKVPESCDSGISQFRLIGGA